MTPKRGFSSKRGRKGFTLVEMLIVVAIVITLLAISIFALITIQKQLRQKELDSKAETIYVAVQRRMVELRASGYESLYQYSEASEKGTYKVGLVPCDASGDTELTDDTLCYVESAKSGELIGESADDIVPEDTIDEALRSNQWHVEYDPKSGSVYGVFYSESDAIPTDKDELDNLRIKKQRLKNGALVGYYGGDLTETEDTDTLYPGITVENKEELKVTFYCNNTAPSEQLTFNITLSDGTNVYKKVLSHDELTRVTSRTYRYVWTLDSLKNTRSRFYSQTEGKLLCGTDLKISLLVESTDDLVDNAAVDTTTNSLFEYNKGSASDTALISYGRHLQNLDNASHVTDTVTKAIQISDLHFDDDENDDADWYSLYGETFTPIENAKIVSYDGKSDINGTEMTASIYGMHIPNKSAGNAGLFKTYAGDISNVTLSGMQIDNGSDVGALIGRTSGAVIINNCRVYLNAAEGDLENITTADDISGVEPWISGSVVGGLIGRSSAQVTINDSFASTVLKASTAAGGLIGRAESTVKAEGIYADCYITAPVTGGLIAQTGTNASVDIENFYAAGYQSASESAAGICAGNIRSAKNGYSACDMDAQRGTAYSTSISGSMTNVYYLSGSNPLVGTTYQTYKELSESGAEKLGSAFTSYSGGATYPYNLMGQGLSTYSYPRLTQLDHYGDWQAEFEPGRLVYFEAYEDGTFAFEGANVSTLASGKKAVGDGYALAYTQDTLPDDGTAVTLSCGPDNKQYSFNISRSDAKTVSYDGETYYLIELPAEVTNPEINEGETFYQKIKVTCEGIEGEYYYNPYFARTVTTNNETPDAPSVIYVRTARQLNALSKYYPIYANETANSIFEQGLDIDYSIYEWSEYTEGDKISAQAPINATNGFTATYNGSYHTIEGLSIESETADTGLFGTIGTGGTVRNVFLTGKAGRETITRYVNGSIAASGSRNSSQIGALAGVNKGTITNCAVSGYTMTYFGYNSNVLALGGLVGDNRGVISSCQADAASVTVTSNSAYAYVGGFVGRNSGTVTTSYSVGQINIIDARSSTVWAAGFAGDNSGGATNRCYAAVAVTASGTTETYGFARIGGAVVDCHYLDGGTYSYAGTLYAYNTSANEFGKADQAAGEPITGSELQSLQLGGFSGATSSYCHDKTGDADDNYVYPAAVKKNGSRVHFGNWPVQRFIGTVGVFYWEYEDSGSNSGYHFSYIGYSDGKSIEGNSLCNEHDDGGVVTKYGYGYFYEAGGTQPTLTSSNTNLGTVNTEAGAALHEQMGAYTFVAYQTGEGGKLLHTTSFTQNGTWTLDYTGTDGTRATYTYEICPFFADAMSLESVRFAGQSVQDMNSAEPGESGRVYQIRSEAQLQFINWNSEKATATYSITTDTYEEQTSDSSRGNRKYVRDRYPYLLSGDPDDSEMPAPTKQLYWMQSHDIDAYEENGGKDMNFTPIGSMYDTGYDDSDAKAYVAFFPYSFDGQAYKIKNIAISSTNQAIGLFGVTAGAQLQNIIMYSDRGNEIVNEANGTGWYTMGGIAGFAGSRKATATESTDSFFKNCTVSGYKIIDKRATSPGWGGGNVGGLAGMTNMDITNCSAVNDIEIRIEYNQQYKNLRVGGITGVCRATINSCYAGGSIVSYDEEDDSGTCSTSCIWVGGISGGIVVRNTGNLQNLIGFVDRSLLVTNCYSYVDLPDAPKSLGQTGYNHVRAAMSIASNGEMLSPFNSRGEKWFNKDDVPARTAYIYNCYALKDNVTGTTDYKNYANASSFNGLDINALDSNYSRQGYTYKKDQVLVYNDSTIYLTYEEMQTKMLASLNKSVSAGYDYVLNFGTRNASTKTETVTETGKFATVTTTEHGAAINGKYSFPGNDEELEGLNYPFPTVLTQTDVFANTVNVHYGAWPKLGIYWEKSSTTFDMYANRKETSGEEMSLLTLKLHIYGTAKDKLSKDDITFCDDEGNILPADEIPLEVYSVSAYTEDESGGYYTVVFKAIGEGTAFVHAKLDDKDAQTVVNVVNEMTIKTSEGKISLKSGDEQAVDLTFHVTDAEGEERQILPESSKLTWEVTIKNGEDAVICDADTVSYNAATGVLKVTVIGRLLDTLTSGEAHISVKCIYRYGTAAYEKLEQSADILAEVESPDFAYISLGEEDAGYRYLHTYTGSSGQNDIGQLSSALTELYGDGLYIRDSYVGFNDIDMSIFAFEADGVTYTPDADGKIWRKIESTASGTDTGEDAGADQGTGGDTGAGTGDATGGDTDTEWECIAQIILGEQITDTENDLVYYSLAVEGYTLENDALLKASLREGTVIEITIPGTPKAEPETPDSSESTKESEESSDESSDESKSGEESESDVESKSGVGSSDGTSSEGIKDQGVEPNAAKSVSGDTLAAEPSGDDISADDDSSNSGSQGNNKGTLISEDIDIPRQDPEVSGARSDGNSAK